jgi:hypothetical protein
VAGEVLRRRADQIARIEATPSAASLVVAPAAMGPITETRTLEVDVPEAKTLLRAVKPASDAGPAPARPRLRPLFVVLAAAIVGLLAGITYVSTRSTGSSPAAPPASVVVPGPPATASETPAAIVSAEEPPLPSASASSGVATASTAASVPAPPRPRPKPTVVAAPGCSPPYYEDPSGIRRVKPQCL